MKIAYTFGVSGMNLFAAVYRVIYWTQESFVADWRLLLFVGNLVMGIIFLFAGLGQIRRLKKVSGQ